MTIWNLNIDILIEITLKINSYNTDLADFKIQMNSKSKKYTKYGKLSYRWKYFTKILSRYLGEFLGNNTYFKLYTLTITI